MPLFSKVLPKTYPELCAVYLPRAIGDKVALSKALEAINALKGFYERDSRCFGSAFRQWSGRGRSRLKGARNRLQLSSSRITRRGLWYCFISPASVWCSEVYGPELLARNPVPVRPRHIAAIANH